MAAIIFSLLQKLKYPKIMILIYKISPPPVVFGHLYVDKRFSLEITFSRDKMYQTRIFSII